MKYTGTEESETVSSEPVVCGMTVIVPVLTFTIFARRCCSFFFGSGEGVGVAAGTFSGSVSETLITFVKLPSYCLSLTRVSLMNLPRKWT